MPDVLVQVSGVVCAGLGNTPKGVPTLIPAAVVAVPPVPIQPKLLELDGRVEVATMK